MVEGLMSSSVSFLSFWTSTDISVVCVENCPYENHHHIPISPFHLGSVRGILSHCSTCYGLRIDHQSESLP